VVGADGSAGARRALDWALREAALHDRAVRVVTVSPVDEPRNVRDEGIDRPDAPGSERTTSDRMRAEAAELAAVAGCDAVPVHAEVRYGRPAEQLVAAAGRGGLLVVGSRGRGSVRGALLGSVSRECAQHARGPVVVVRDDEDTHGAVLWQGAASRVVVGVDGSAGSVSALRFAAAEAVLRGGELHVVHAWIDSLSGFGGAPWARPATPLRELARTTLRESLQAASERGLPDVQVRAETLEGVEWDVLTEVSQAADLLVVGARGRSGGFGSLLGSVSLRCISHAPCPVAVVRPLGI